MSFQVETEVREVCVLYSWLFNIHMDGAIKELRLIVMESLSSLISDDNN